MPDAYWNKSDPFEHDVYELFAHAISPEEFIKKWKSKIIVRAHKAVKL